MDSQLALGDGNSPELTRDQLPRTLQLWRKPDSSSGGIQAAENAIWDALHRIFERRGYKLWKYFGFGCMFIPDSEEPAEVSSGFAYAPPHRGEKLQPGSVRQIFEFQSLNPLCRPARTKEGRDVVIRAMVVGERGKEHLEILQLIAKGSLAFYSNNHTIPLLDTVYFEDITFGIFPKVGFRVAEAYGHWAQNSVGDVVNMLLQCLEALEFLQDAGVAHRDAFKDNFLVEWHPESILAGHPARSVPRVYLTDFEVAVHFPVEASYEECVASGIPMNGSFPDDTTQYKRQVPPEVASGGTYNAMKLDVWQLATSFEDFRSTIPEIDGVLECMRNPDPSARMDSSHALHTLGDILTSIPPKSLLIPPVVLQGHPAEPPTN
ncbi:hypothetical protein FKP32DRAFT_91342 [Trametes sanguinea]|nr:hypothetical protein FKP32DRAFT_91342 [Trametes sanguinea]